jgi:hypothetical protein
VAVKANILTVYSYYQLTSFTLAWRTRLYPGKHEGQKIRLEMVGREIETSVGLKRLLSNVMQGKVWPCHGSTNSLSYVTEVYDLIPKAGRKEF